MIAPGIMTIFMGQNDYKKSHRLYMQLLPPFSDCIALQLSSMTLGEAQMITLCSK